MLNMFKVNKITFDKINLSYLKFERRPPNSSNFTQYLHKNSFDSHFHLAEKDSIPT